MQDLNFQKGKAGPEELFVPTPPLVAACYTVSHCTSGPGSGSQRRRRRRLVALDFEKAFLNGDMEREVCIFLPAEDPRSDGGRNVGYLKKAMYGLREAPAIWQGVVRKLMDERGFIANPIIPCLYYHPVHDVVVTAHVDDFLACGEAEVLRDLEAFAGKVRLRRGYFGVG